MSEAAYVGNYWGPPEESADEVSTRLAAFLTAVASVTPLLAKWGAKGKSATDFFRIFRLSSDPHFFSCVFYQMKIPSFEIRESS